MTSYLSALSTHYSSLKRLLPTANTSSHDLTISDPNDSHVSRVLRAYYLEKGRPFPSWLGPDPSHPTKNITPALSYGQTQQQGSQYRPATSHESAGGGGLGDLFGDRRGNPADAELANATKDMSLRSRLRAGGRGGPSPATATAGTNQSYQGPSGPATPPAQSSYTVPQGTSPSGARPLPAIFQERYTYSVFE